MKFNELVEFNPKETINHNMLVKKVSMDQLDIFTRKISNFSYGYYTGGSKFRNGDTLMARITPCLENGKTAYVNILDEDEVAFGSTEFTVIRAKPNICINEFAYYLTISSLVRPYAIESMVGSTGRQRVQQDVVENLEIPHYSIEEQQHIVNILGSIDEKIENNERKILKIKELEQLIFKNFQEKISTNSYHLGEFILFIKGRKPNDSTINMLPYLTIDGMETEKYIEVCSDNMIIAKEEDIIMVMDGASSGTVYSGYNGVVGSTLAKLSLSNTHLTPLIEQRLIQTQEKIKELNTGSAIPHANKEFIQSIEILLSNDKFQEQTIGMLNSLKNEILMIRKINVKLNRLKQIYIKKFFG